MLKYFTLEELPREEWDKRLLAYWAEFDKVKHRLPKNVVNAFHNRNLHDSEIKQISFHTVEKSKYKRLKTVTVAIANDVYAGTFIHEGVLEFSSNYSFTQKYVMLCEYLYGEILFENGNWTHSFVCSDSMEVFIRCKKIKWDP